MNYIVIDDTYDVEHDKNSGRCGTWKRTAPVGSLPYAQVADFTTTPRSEWKGIVQQQEIDKSRLIDVIEFAGIPCLDQKQTSFCHAFSPTLAIMIDRAVQGQPYVLLSPASIAGPVTGFRNEGAVISDDLKQIVKGGVASQEFVPPTQVSRDGFKQGWEQNALQHRVTEWWDLGSKNSKMVDRCATLLLSGIPVCVGYQWWAHAVTLVGLVFQNDKPNFLFRNSWGPDWPKAGANGYGLLPVDGKGNPDDAYAPRSIVIAS